MRRDQKSFKLPFMVLILEFIKSAYPVGGSKWSKMAKNAFGIEPSVILICCE